MKFICGNCKAKYQIADEKIGRRTLSMVCRQCGKEILIQPPQRPSGEFPATRLGEAQMAQMNPAPSVLAADFHRQVAGGVRENRPFTAATEWHVAINDIPVGPMHREEIARKIALGAVTGDSLAWREGLDDWMPARSIPELAVLFLKPPSPPTASVGSSESLDHRYAPRPPKPPEEPTRPAARSPAIPIGGRRDVPQAVDEFLPPVTGPDPSFEEVAVSPLSSEAKVRPQQGQSWGPMFVMVCGGALIMMIGVVVGVKMLGSSSSDEKQTQAESGEAADSDDEPQTSGEIIELELQEIGGDVIEEKASNQTKKGNTTSQKGAIAAASKGNSLSAEEKAMLERMGGNFGQNPSLKLKSSSSSASSAKKSGLKAEQLAAVVSRGKRQLQRCYEAALRSNPSDETIRLDIDLTVGMSGTVTKMSARGKSLGDMNECIKRTIRMWRFPTSGNETRTSFPVVFQPGV